MTLKTRQPTGKIAWPLLLLEGEEMAGKTWAAIALSASEKVGQTYVLDLGEGSADEYANIPGAKFLMLARDDESVPGPWTYAEILARLRAVKEEAVKAVAEGLPPVVLVIDSMTAEWTGICDWVNSRAVKSSAGQRALQRDPNAEVKASMNLWNDAASRHARIMNVLMTFPGIVVMTARGKVVAEMDDAGKPKEGVKTWKVEGHKNLAFDASAWIRLTRKGGAEVIGLRSTRFGIRPGVDPSKPLPAEWDLEWFIFTALGINADTAAVRNVSAVDGGALTEDEKADEAAREASGESAVRPAPSAPPAAPAAAPAPAEATVENPGAHAGPPARPEPTAPEAPEESATAPGSGFDFSSPDAALAEVRKVWDDVDGLVAVFTALGEAGLLQHAVRSLEDDSVEVPLGLLIRDRGQSLRAAASAAGV